LLHHPGKNIPVILAYRGQSLPLTALIYEKTASLDAVFSVFLQRCQHHPCSMYQLPDTMLADQQDSMITVS